MTHTPKSRHALIGLNKAKTPVMSYPDVVPKISLSDLFFNQWPGLKKTNRGCSLSVISQIAIAKLVIFYQNKSEILNF